MSDPQAAAVDNKALDKKAMDDPAVDDGPAATPQPDSDAGDDGQRRRLLSLSSQKRRPQERLQERHQARPEQRTAKTKDSKPPEDDPMARALELLSGIDENVRDAERSPGASDNGSSPAEEGRPASGSQPVAEEGDGASESILALQGAAEGAGDEETEEVEVGRYEEVIRREDASPVVAKEAKRNPAKALYSLQEVHERTGIPYATLALYAANHADRIPSLGERRSPAYPRQGLEELCRIHAEKNPDWERPAAGTEAGWDDQDGLARRIEVLGEGLDRLNADLREIQSIVRRGWSAEVSLFD